MLKRRTIIIFLSSLIIAIPFLMGMVMPKKAIYERAKKAEIKIETEPDLVIHEGYVSQTEETVLVKQGKKTIARVHLSEPVMVAMAEQEEKWGYFQFPNIGKAEDGTLVIDWQMNEDSQMSYGKKSKRAYTPMMSKDGGRTWTNIDKGYLTRSRGYNLFLENGVYFQISTPKTKNIGTYASFPKPVSINGKYAFYKEESLPQDLKGVYINHRSSEGKVSQIHANLADPGLLRCADSGWMSVVWWGNMKQLADSSIVAGIYPGFYLDDSGKVLPGGVPFYKSDDNGRTWKRIGLIPCTDNYKYDANTRNEGFTEPAFEILSDSTFICVMRTGSAHPLYQSVSKDRGITWSETKPITSNGVKPNLMLLKNGVVALVSGRPGLQLRFNIDGKGLNWSTPIEMLPFMNEERRYNLFASCGYASVLEAEDNSFYMVYSDFTAKNEKGEQRKAIMFRKITVKK